MSKPKQLKPNSTNSTISMDLRKEGLSAEDVVRIMEGAAISGVSELQFGDLHVWFGPPSEPQVEPSSLPMSQAAAPPPVAALTAQQHEKISKEWLEEEQIRLREEQIARAMVEDPERFEQLVRDGELSDGLVGTDEE